MVVKFDKAYFIKELGAPEHLVSALMETPRRLPGERLEDYSSFFTAALNELLPTTDLEWLVAPELAWLLWDIQRYKRWFNAVIFLQQRAALGEALYKTDPNYSEVEPRTAIHQKSQMKADALNGNLKGDPGLARELEECGYDQVALNAIAFAKAAPLIAVIEKFLASTRKQFATILRDVAVRREFVARARLLEKKIAAERREQDAQSRVAAAFAECEKTNKETT